MKTIKILTVLFVIGLITYGCSDDKDEKYPVVDPYELYLTNTGFSVTSNFVNSSSYEFGLVFSPKYNGTINALKLKLPAVSNSVRITIWDYETKEPIRTEIVNVAEANVLTVKNIEKLNVQKDKKYLISMNSDDWYRRIRSDNANAPYPIESGNIVFYEYRWLSGSGQVFPTIVSLNYNAGDLSFEYQRK
jgi:hypothetical protein